MNGNDAYFGDRTHGTQAQWALFCDAYGIDFDSLIKVWEDDICYIRLINSNFRSIKKAIDCGLNVENELNIPKKLPDNIEYYHTYCYIIGTETQWKAWSVDYFNATKYRARLDNEGNNYLIEDTYFDTLSVMRSDGLIIFQNIQAAQLGCKYKDIRDAHGDRILNDNKEIQNYYSYANFLFSIDKDCPEWFSDELAIINYCTSAKQLLVENLFTAFEIIES